MAKRLRRFTMTVGGVAVEGARNFEFDDQTELNADRADDEGAGDIVRMTTGPYDVRWEMIAGHAQVATGYKAAIVVTAKEISVANGAETSANRIYTFSNGHIVVGGNFPTESPGRIPVRGQFKTLAIT